MGTQQTVEKEDNDVDKQQENPFNDDDIPENRLIRVSSEIDLPFSAYDAYDAYADLPRQPSWSSWLESVVVSKENPEESTWTLRFWGMKYSWVAVAVKNERPHLIQWRSTTGLRNYGTVRFYERTPDQTLMTMQMTFVAPRAVSMVFNKSRTLAKYVEDKLITQSLRDFRDVVLEHDLKDRSKN